MSTLPSLHLVKGRARAFTNASYPYQHREVGELDDCPGVTFRRPLLREEDTSSYFGVLVHVRCQGCERGYNFQLRILDTAAIGQDSMTSLTLEVARLIACQDLVSQGLSREEASQRISVRLLGTAYRSSSRMPRAAFSHYLTSDEALQWASNLKLAWEKDQTRNGLSFLSNLSNLTRLDFRSEREKA